jgi:hypothetical protein
MQEGMGRFAAIALGILFLVLIAQAFKPDSRQTIELHLSADGVPAANVEVGLFKPDNSSTSECVGADPGTLGAGPMGQTGGDGGHLWRRRIPSAGFGDRYTDRAVRRRIYALKLCAFVEGKPLALWEDAPRQAHRLLRLDCSLSTQSCRATYAHHLDEWLRPILEAGAVVLFLLVATVGRTPGHAEAGTGWLCANGFFFPFVQAYAGWLHRFPATSKVVSVMILIWGAMVLFGLLVGWIQHLARRRRD